LKTNSTTWARLLAYVTGLSMKGESDAMTVPVAVEMIRATSPEDRSPFAEEIWQRRWERWTDKQVPF
jgi:hypothetical protein